MSRSRRIAALGSPLLFLLVVAVASVFAVDVTTPVFTAAPIDDLSSRVDFYIKRIESSLANQGEYDESQQKRVGNDASTIAGADSDRLITSSPCLPCPCADLERARSNGPSKSSRFRRWV